MPRSAAGFAARAMIAAPTAVLGAAGGWWALSKRLPALDDEEWPYVGSAAAVARRIEPVTLPREHPLTRAA